LRLVTSDPVDPDKLRLSLARYYYPFLTDELLKRRDDEQVVKMEIETLGKYLKASGKGNFQSKVLVVQ
jgi:hypothetical protein